MAEQNFQAVLKSGVNVITCPAIINADEKLEAHIKEWLLSPVQVHVLDFKEVTEFRVPAYRQFLLFNQTLKSNNKRFFYMNANQRIKSQLAQDGLGAIFIDIKNLDEALVKNRVGGYVPVIDAEFLNPFISATKMVLETQANTPVTSGKARVKKDDEQHELGIVGVISLVNPVSTGSISICFPTKVFLKIYENMVGEIHTSITRETEDAAGELLNIIFGQAKSVLNDEKGHHLERCIPTIMAGDKLRLHHQTRNPVIILPFESAAGAFHLEIIVDKE
jgi:chemotaxis protein CheX